jgi:hypothetical protein
LQYGKLEQTGKLNQIPDRLGDMIASSNQRPYGELATNGSEEPSQVYNLNDKDKELLIAHLRDGFGCWCTSHSNQSFWSPAHSNW